jgi:anaerobic selenocysteine-containing dehydrogenase
MTLREATSFCRICTGGCGLRMKIDENERIVDIRGDRENPMTDGYACFKGLQAEEAHHGASRLLHPLKRQPDGSFARIGVEQALDEIADRIRPMIEAEGPEALALFLGGGATMTATANAMHTSFMEAVGSPQIFSTLTIDQSAKIISFERLGGWAAGVQDLDQSEVLLLFGANPLVSHATVGVMSADPTKRLKKARARGLKLICVDPRRSETARHADVFLQPIPGQDSAIAAGLIRLILSEGWEDKQFCADHVGGDRMEALRAAVAAFDEAYVERRAGIEPGSLRAAASLFARESRSGAAFTATGPSMAPFSNLTQHLVDCLNVICGRFRRAGDRYIASMLSPPLPVHAEVIAAPRSWEDVPPSRIRGVGRLGGERLTATLAEEILTPGAGQIKCLVVDGGNPATGVPDQRRMVEALEKVDLLVTIDPYMTATAQLSDYILPPLMQLERADIPLNIPGFPLFPDSWAQYASPVLRPPTGSELINDWYFYWSIARRLGIAIDFQGKAVLDTDRAPSSDDLIGIMLDGSRITLDELKRHPSGKVYDVADCRVLPGRPEADARFDVIPSDVAEELRDFRSREIEPGDIRSNGERFTHLLSSRRSRDVMNSIGTQLRTVLARMPANPAYLNPRDLAVMGMEPGDHVEIESDFGRIEASVQPDDGVRPGVISMSHGWGSLPDRDGHAGSCVNLLISTERDVESLNAMPRMSAVPVNIRLIARSVVAA